MRHSEPILYFHGYSYCTNGICIMKYEIDKYVPQDSYSPLDNFITLFCREKMESLGASRDSLFMVLAVH